MIRRNQTQDNRVLLRATLPDNLQAKVGAEVVFNVSLENLSDSELRINMTAGCGCTTGPGLVTLAPNAAMDVEFKFTAKSKGKFDKTVTFEHQKLPDGQPVRLVRNFSGYAQ